ncbi:MAG: hypothetical protein PWP21_1687 [Thermosediminibacterales bacterium]|nr:hypothetical protein [Thermosediminibacterales bacterium]
MSQSWHNLISLGLVHPMLYPEVANGEGPILETVEKLLEDTFFDAIELTYVKDAKTRRQLSQMFEISDVEVVVCGGAPLIINGYDLNSLDDTKRNQAIEFCKELVDQAYEYSAKILMLVSGENPDVGNQELAEQKFIESMHEICDYAWKVKKDYLLTISIEYFPTNLPKKFLIGSTKKAVEISEKVRENHKNFGLTVDLSHIHQLLEDPRDSILLAKEHIIHAHLSNCVIKDKSHPQYGDEHPRYNIKGGEVDEYVAADFIKNLIEAGFFSKELPTKRPVFSLEIKRIKGEPPNLTIANAKRVFQKAWNLIG